MADPIGVVVCGPHGRMGSETVLAVEHDAALQLVGVVSRRAGDTFGVGARSIPASDDLASLVDATHPACVVDFTTAEAALQHGRITLGRGIAFVTGTTGLGLEDLVALRELADGHRVGCLVAPNFAIGAVLATHFATLAAKHFAWAEVIELHHERKVDAPSGTALATARAMVAARGVPFEETEVTKQTLPGTRGGEVGGVHVHSVRLPGFVAHQEILFGGQGEVLTIRHDSTHRSSFMPGVLLAIKHVVAQPGFVFGLGPLLGVEGQGSR
jgi:4-hydroxy-tetrahydrodipicolinate reductase